MSLIAFLYRYIFRGLGIVLVMGMLTILALAIIYQTREQRRPQGPGQGPGQVLGPAAERRAP